MEKTSSYLQVVEQWIEACNHLHKELCFDVQVAEHSSEDTPFWLVDTRQRCIVRGFPGAQYLALSYVWQEDRGPNDLASSLLESLLLDHMNMTDMQKPGYLDREEHAQRIPGVIKHAMDLTLRLGKTYLWVDRLCIVQNELGDGGTLSQVTKMDKIYAGAYLTIIAAAPERMYEASVARTWPLLRSVTSSQRWQREKVRIRCVDGKIVNKEAGLLATMRERYYELSTSRWATRGWTYQEQILCKRAIIFLDDGIFWDCQCATWDGTDLQPDQDFSYVSFRADMGRRLSTRWWPDFGLYLDLICPYNKRELSYPQDAAFAISGILNALKESFPGGFIHGLPRLFFDSALLWQPFDAAWNDRRRLDRGRDGSQISSLPSWSWLGWQCLIDPWSLRSGLSYSDEMIYQGRAQSWRTRNLVEWNILVGEGGLEPIVEPLLLDHCINIAAKPDAQYLDGWTITDASNEITDPANGISQPSFVHLKDKSIRFEHPIPLKETLAESNLLATPAYLVGSTYAITSFLPAVFLQVGIYKFMSTVPKISIVEDKIFEKCMSPVSTCPILVLQQPNGSFAGLIRLMNTQPFNWDSPCELVAISTGSANSEDLRTSFEWSIFETGRHNRIHSENELYCCQPEFLRPTGFGALLASVQSAFDKDASVSRVPTDLLESRLSECERYDAEFLSKLPYYGGRNDLAASKSDDGEQQAKEEEEEDEKLNAMKDEFRKRRLQRNWFLTGQSRVSRKSQRAKQNATTVSMMKEKEVPLAKNEEVPEAGGLGMNDRVSGTNDNFTCHFYNVLWIERKDGVAYRRACGWIPKYIWEAHSTGPVEIKLG